MPTPRIAPDALEFVRRVEAKHGRQILLTILDLASEPFPPGCKKLRATEAAYWRVRTGDYRIVYRVVGDVLFIDAIGKRGDDEVYDDVRRKGL